MNGNMVTGKTKVCVLLGDPVEHTMSPAMHNAAFAALGLDYIYIPFRVGAGELAAAVAGLKALNVRGFNVTIPHKVAVMPLLDRLDPMAEKIGAVNTVVNDEGVLTGCNTDAAGFLRALREQGIEPAGRNVVILGAGGASRAVSYILAENGARLTIVNREVELDWAKELARRLYADFHREVNVLGLASGELPAALREADILVNATSVGMNPLSEASPVLAALLTPRLVVYDVVYSPVMTRLLRDAESIGARTISGIDMLVWQGALAFEKWTGQQPPFDLMREKVIAMVEGA